MLSQVDIDDYEQPDFVPLSELKEGDSFEYLKEHLAFYTIKHIRDNWVYTLPAGMFHIDTKVKKLCTT